MKKLLERTKTRVGKKSVGQIKHQHFGVLALAQV
jgi:hypothetical protein